MTTLELVEPRPLPETATKTLAYRPEVDGLRAVAIVPVLFFHAGIGGFANGYLGVDIFFVISGYLITSLLCDERRRTGTVSILGFYERRVRRIVPALVFVVASTTVGAWFLLTPIRMEEFAGSVVATFTFSANFWFLAQTHYFSTAADQQPLLHLWSLGVEEQFYVLFPLLILLTIRASDRTLAFGIAGLAAASLMLGQIVSMMSPDAAFYRPDTRAWQLLIGSVCAFVTIKNVPYRETVSIFGIALIGLSLFVLPGPVAPNLLSVPICLGTAFVLVSATARSGVGRALAAPGVTNIGLISYSLYLWHQPLLALARIQHMGALSPAMSFWILLVSAILAIATWHFVEAPFRNRGRFGRASIFAAGIAAAVALIGFGTGGNATAGYSFRYGELAAKYFEAVGVIDDQGSTRSKAIGMGVCHFRADMSPPIEQFLRDWKCTGSGEGASILVIGDSHAADKAAAFKLNGVDVAQMTGAGCSAAPSLMSADCRRIFDWVKEYAKTHRILALVIANMQFPNVIYTPERIDDALRFWQPVGGRIFWFSDMPQFVDIEDWKARNLIANGDASKGAIPITLAEAKSSFDTMHSKENGRFTTIDSKRLYCAISEQNDCAPYLAGQGWLATAGGHLSAVGAYLFGRQLLSDPDISLDIRRH
ncbi:acyltransferase [Mesorhizobium loti]|nr:acyltransferase [Mesorhizobium loti]